ncbi:MAG: dihydroorotase [Chitinophagaceae bacterium]|nr:MAG: dihydroorotase [Chitinophagaceae bacterium]
MKVLIKQAVITCSSSPLNGQVKDIFLNNGIIQKIADNIEAEADEVFSKPNLHVSIGWMDVFAQFGDPGTEHRETLQSGAAAAAAGGYTDVMLLPNTNPAISTKTVVEYIVQKAKHLPVTIHPIANVTKNGAGKELTEMYDMHDSGAIAFGDGTQSIQSAGILLKALQYVLPLNATIVQVPDDESIGSHGLMNEGIVSTQLGLPGKPAIAEEMMIARDIELLKYTQSKLHITGVSTKNAVELIASAKQDGLKITCSVSPAHLFFCDEDLVTYDTNLKLNPPLRTRADRDALREAFKCGVIDCLASHHVPCHWDDKTCEFEYARNGMLALQTAFAVANQFAGNASKLVEQLTEVPRKIFGLEVPQIKEGEVACLTLFDPAADFTLGAEDILSTSANTPFVGKALKGKVWGTIHKNQLNLRK